MEVFCINKSMGCTFSGIFKFIHNHEKKCKFAIFDCPNCFEKILLKDYEKHQETCNQYSRNSNCQFCRQSVPYHKLQEHQEKFCPMRCMSQCPDCGKQMMRELLAKHIKTEHSRKNLCKFFDTSQNQQRNFGESLKAQILEDERSFNLEYASMQTKLQQVYLTR